MQYYKILRKKEGALFKCPLYILHKRNYKSSTCTFINLRNGKEWKRNEEKNNGRAVSGCDTRHNA